MGERPDQHIGFSERLRSHSLPIPRRSLALLLLLIHATIQAIGKLKAAMDEQDKYKKALVTSQEIKRPKEACESIQATSQ